MSAVYTVMFVTPYSPAKILLTALLGPVNILKPAPDALNYPIYRWTTSFALTITGVDLSIDWEDHEHLHMLDYLTSYK